VLFSLKLLEEIKLKFDKKRGKTLGKLRLPTNLTEKNWPQNGANSKMSKHKNTAQILPATKEYDCSAAWLQHNALLAIGVGRDVGLAPENRRPKGRWDQGLWRSRENGPSIDLHKPSMKIFRGK